MGLMVAKAYTAVKLLPEYGRQGRSMIKVILCLFTLTILLYVSAPASAASISIIQDSEIENLLKDYFRPLEKGAGIRANSLKPIIVNDGRLNAFVTGGKEVFVNYGLILNSRRPNEAIGVLAHEIGHYKGNHASKLQIAMQQARTVSLVEMLLSSAAIIAGAANGSDIRYIPTPSIGVAGRGFLSYKRNQEFAADKSALKYLRASGQSARGLLDLFKQMFKEQASFNRKANIYLRTHPFPRDRISRLEKMAKASPYWNSKDSQQLIFRHAMARAKLIGYTQSKAVVGRVYRLSDNSLPARYARAINDIAKGNKRRGLAAIDALIKRQPNNPYFLQIKGQALIERGKPAQAVTVYKRAVKLLPRDGKMKIQYGSSLVLSQNRTLLKEAISQLKQGLALNGADAFAYRQLAMAYGRLGNTARAHLATAELYFMQRRYDLARMQARIARQKLKKGSPGWLRADDIVSYRR